MKCNQDCFNCPFPDCIEDEMTASDYDEARERDREIIFPKSRKEKELAAKQKAYREANREKRNAYMRDYRKKRRLANGQNQSCNL